MDAETAGREASDGEQVIADLSGEYRKARFVDPEVPPRFSVQTLAFATPTTTAVFLLSGSLDMHSAVFLRQLIHRAVSEYPEFAAFVFDITALNYLDAAGLVLLAELRRKWGKTHGIALVVPLRDTQPFHQPFHLLNQTRLFLLFPCRLSYEEAAQAAGTKTVPLREDQEGRYVDVCWERRPEGQGAVRINTWIMN